MYPSYPSGAQLPDAPPAAAPDSVMNAVRLMYAGAAASLIGIVVDVATASSSIDGFRRKSPSSFTGAHAESLRHALIGGWIVDGAIAIILWLVLSWACRKGKNWGRITGTVFFAIATIDILAYIVTPFATVAKIIGLLVWLCGLGATILLWRRSSSPYFRRTPA
jgi:hypothetical protein